MNTKIRVSNASWAAGSDLSFPSSLSPPPSGNTLKQTHPSNKLLNTIKRGADHGILRSSTLSLSSQFNLADLPACLGLPKLLSTKCRLSNIHGTLSVTHSSLSLGLLADADCLSSSSPPNPSELAFALSISIRPRSTLI